VSPTYQRIGDHSESVEIVYDPALLSYEQLLELFWASHDPTDRAYSRQYASIIFYHNEEQRRLAERSRIQQEQKRGRAVQTEILPVAGFTEAEGYHQKYYLQNAGDLLESLKEVLPTGQALVRSTLAARLNALAAGQESPAELRRELQIFGLAPAQQKLLLEILGRRGR
jgi:peptide-methionine (S)-S-oxide reductase